jgi:hypothetical protein
MTSDNETAEATPLGRWLDPNLRNACIATASLSDQHADDAGQDIPRLA